MVLNVSGTLSGSISVEGTLSGRLSCPITESEHIAYTGDTIVTPKAFNSQTLETANKIVKENIIIKEVPYWETSNVFNGTTAYIAKEV